MKIITFKYKKIVKLGILRNNFVIDLSDISFDNKQIDIIYLLENSNQIVNDFDLTNMNQIPINDI